MDKGFGKNRGKITDMTWTNPMDKKEVIKINSAAELESMLRKNPQFRAHYNNALSPKFLTLKNKVAMKFLSKMKTNCEPARRTQMHMRIYKKVLSFHGQHTLKLALPLVMALPPGSVHVLTPVLVRLRLPTRGSWELDLGVAVASTHSRMVSPAQASALSV